MISLTKEQDRKLTDMAKQKGFSKSAVCSVSYRRICKKGIRTKKISEISRF